MKKFLVILITLLCFFPINVFASGSISVNRGSLSITKGSSSSFVVSANNAAGRVDIYSSNSSVAKVSTSSSWLDNNSVTVTVTGVNDGNATIIVKITDAATYDEEALSGTRSVSVNVYSNTSSNNVSNNNSQNSNQSKPSNSSKYNNSSNTKKNEPIKNDDVKKKSSTLKQKNKKSQKQAKLEVKTIMYIVIGFAILFAISYRNSLITASFNQKESLKKQLSTLQKENAQTEINIQTSLNLTNIEKSASSMLGMKKLSDSQKVYVSLPKEDYVETASEQVVVTEEQNWFEKIINTITDWIK